MPGTLKYEAAEIPGTRGGCLIGLGYPHGHDGGWSEGKELKLTDTGEGAKKLLLNKALYEYSSMIFKLSFLLGKYLGMELLSHMVSEYLTL